MLIETATYLGPATVDRSGGDWVDLTLPDGRAARGRTALAVPVQLAGGDEVLVIAQEPERFYVIGILRASGPTTLRLPGGLAIQAPEGAVTIDAGRPIRLESRQAVSVAAPRVTIRAGRLETLAVRAVERIGDVFLWVRGLFQVKARRWRAVADEQLVAKSRRTHLKSQGDFSIDGKTIHLG